MRKWLVKVVEGRYRCWDDFLQYGMLSAGHGDPPADPLKFLTAGDEVYAFLNTRGYVGRGQVASAAVLAAEFVVSGNFVSMDGSMRSKRVRLSEILLLRRSDMTNEGNNPLVGEWVVGVRWLATWPRKKAKRFDGMQEPRGTVEELIDAETARFLASAFVA
jgi:hypothetical protein